MSHTTTTDYCPRCDRACERNAALVVMLRNTARELHVALRHPMPETRWFDCEELECRRRWALIQGARV